MEKIGKELLSEDDEVRVRELLLGTHLL